MVAYCSLIDSNSFCFQSERKMVTIFHLWIISTNSIPSLFFSVDINFNLHHCSVLNKFWKDLLIRNLSLVCKIKRLRISASITLKIHQEHDYDIFNLVEPLSATLNISNNSLEPNQQLESDHFFITWKLLSSKIWRSCWTNTFVSIDYLVNEYELLMKSDFV